jgi:ADP-ribose pyrophosphatase
MAKRKQAERAERELLGEGKYLRLVRDGRWEIAERTNALGAVAIIAITPDRRLVLTEQPRSAVRRPVIDLAAGLVGDEPDHDGEPLAETARRELLEETGYAAKKMVHLVDCPSSPGLTNEIISYFLANDVKKTQVGGGVAHEKIIVHAPTLRGIRKWLAQQIASGKLIDVKVYLALYFARSLRRSHSK